MSLKSFLKDLRENHNAKVKKLNKNTYWIKLLLDYDKKIKKTYRQYLPTYKKYLIIITDIEGHTLICDKLWYHVGILGYVIVYYDWWRLKNEN